MKKIGWLIILLLVIIIIGATFSEPTAPTSEQSSEKIKVDNVQMKIVDISITPLYSVKVQAKDKKSSMNLISVEGKVCIVDKGNIKPIKKVVFYTEDGKKTEGTLTINPEPISTTSKVTASNK